MARVKLRKGGKRTKRAKELASRVADYEQTLKKLSGKQATGFRKPGSMTGRQ